MAETKYPEAGIGELWQDASGCLYATGINKGDWYAFGAGELISESNPGMEHPLTLVAGIDGKFVVDRLNYSDEAIAEMTAMREITAMYDAEISKLEQKLGA